MSHPKLMPSSSRESTRSKHKNADYLLLNLCQYTNQRKQSTGEEEQEEDKAVLFKEEEKGRESSKETFLEDLQMQTQTEQQQQQQILRMRNSERSHRESTSEEEEDDAESSSARTALSAFRAKEEEIERKKMEIREKVYAQLGRVEEESKRLAKIKHELEAMTDPTRKEVAALRKKIDAVNQELKPLGQNCIRKEKEYKEALEAFNGKNREKAQLVNKLMELVSESERLRMKKLEELSRTIDSLR